MAKIHFIQDNIINESLGTLTLSSYLKANGHEVDLTFLSDHKSSDSLMRQINESNPDIIGFSAMTPQVDYYRSVTKLIKENSDYMVIWGGPHCIFMPEVEAKRGLIDIMCVGEGEEALLSLMNRLDAKENYEDIPSLWVNKNGDRITNEVASLGEKEDKSQAGSLISARISGKAGDSLR